MQFLNIKTDFAFKKVFGSKESVPLLVSFLNAVLELDDVHKITTLQIKGPYQVPQIEGMKDSYVDVKAELTDGSSVIIEMQVLNVNGFEKRVLYNAAKSYSTQDAFEIVNTACMSADELELQQRQHDWIWLQKGSIETAVAKAKKIAEKEAAIKAERAEKAAIEAAEAARKEAVDQVAINLLDILGNKTIAEKTGLGEEQITALRDQQRVR